MHACVIILSVPLPARCVGYFDTVCVPCARWLPGPAFLMPSTPLLLTRLAFEALSLIMVDYLHGRGRGARIDYRERERVSGTAGITGCLNSDSFLRRGCQRNIISLKHPVREWGDRKRLSFDIRRIRWVESMPNSHRLGGNTDSTRLSYFCHMRFCPFYWRIELNFRNAKNLPRASTSLMSPARPPPRGL